MKKAETINKISEIFYNNNLCDLKEEKFRIKFESKKGGTLIRINIAYINSDFPITLGLMKSLSEFFQTEAIGIYTDLFHCWEDAQFVNEFHIFTPIILEDLDNSDVELKEFEHKLWNYLENELRRPNIQ